MVQIDLEIRWKTRGRNAFQFDPNLFMLLKFIQAEGSLKSASDNTNISYRNAWGVLRELERLFGTPVAVMERGRGTKLTGLGEKLLQAEQEFRSRFATDLSDAATRLNSDINHILHPQQRAKLLTMYASNDLGIEKLYEYSQATGRSNIDLQFHGSLESLQALATGRCDIAGFHFPEGKLSAALAPLYRKWLDNDRYRLVIVGKRQQGIITRMDNPHRIKDLTDLTRRAIRFVNRQRESGTRTILDELLKQAKINRKSIKGYLNEEFTHSAVAAMIGSGAADAGFGIRAYACKFGLHFVPVVEETYAIAVKQDKLADVIVVMKKILQSKKYRDAIKRLPGYDPLHAGDEMTVTEFFR